MIRRALPLLLLMIAACGEQRPPAPTAEESDRLNAADAMLDQLSNDEGPAAEAADPSNRSK